MHRTEDSQTGAVIESNRQLVETLQNLIARSKRECEQLRATIRQSRRIVEGAKGATRN